MDIGEHLSPGAITLIKKSSYLAFLTQSLSSLCERAPIVWILSNCKLAKHNIEEVIVLDLDPKTVRPMTSEALKIIHGCSRGTKDVPKDIHETPKVEVLELQKFILQQNPGCKGNSFIDISHIVEACKAARRRSDIAMEVRLFLAALFQYSYFTTTSLYISKKALEDVVDLKEIATKDWCKLLLEHLRSGVENFQHNEHIWSQVSFLVSIFEISFLFYD